MNSSRLIGPLTVLSSVSTPVVELKCISLDWLRFSNNENTAFLRSLTVIFESDIKLGVKWMRYSRSARKTDPVRILKYFVGTKNEVLVFHR